MYAKRRELRRNNWGHRYRAAGHDVRELSRNEERAAEHDRNLRARYFTEKEAEDYKLRFGGQTSRDYYNMLFEAQDVAARERGDALVEEEKTAKKPAKKPEKSKKKG